MHQADKGVCCEPVIDEEVFSDREFRVFRFQISGAVVIDAMAKNEVLSTCGGTDRIGLEVAQLAEGRLQRRGRKRVLRTAYERSVRMFTPRLQPAG